METPLIPSLLLFPVIWFIPLHILFMLMAVYHLMHIKTSDSVLRLTWLIILVFIPFLGSLYYLIFGIRQLTPS